MGNGPREKPLFPGLGSPAIAHDELIASTGVVTVRRSRARFPRESLAAALKIYVSITKKNLRAWRRCVLPATITPLTASII
jgi:hypothetical protein